VLHELTSNWAGVARVTGDFVLLPCVKEIIEKKRWTSVRREQEM
jgi:hypothetical protein